MKREKAHKLLGKVIDGTFMRGWKIGHAVGYSDGVDDGVMSHKEMIRNRLKMYLDTCMNTNKMREAQFTSEMIQYLMWEYDPEQAEADLKAEEESSDGYGLIL